MNKSIYLHVNKINDVANMLVSNKKNVTLFTIQCSTTQFLFPKNFCSLVCYSGLYQEFFLACFTETTLKKTNNPTKKQLR